MEFAEIEVERLWGRTRPEEGWYISPAPQRHGHEL